MLFCICSILHQFTLLSILSYLTEQDAYNTYKPTRNCWLWDDNAVSAKLRHPRFVSIQEVHCKSILKNLINWIILKVFSTVGKNIKKRLFLISKVVMFSVQVYSKIFFLTTILQICRCILRSAGIGICHRFCPIWNLDSHQNFPINLISSKMAILAAALGNCCSASALHRHRLLAIQSGGPKLN